jgi:peptidoglycan hydrolase-like protein with peptidoglycan-binding domain
MKIDLPQHPNGLHKKASSPRSLADSDNEYASFSAQLAARAERLSAAAAAPASAPGSYPEELASHSPFSLLASGRTGHVWAGILLLLFISVSVLAVWGLPFQPSAPLPSNRTEQAKAGVPSTGKLEANVSSPVSAPPVAAPLVSAPPASPRTATPPPISPAAGPLPVASPPAPKEFAKSTPESSPKASQIQSTAQASSAPLTPDEIRELQGRLKAAGFNPGAIDGTIGRQTRSTVREYAEARALPNADATRELLVRLKAERQASVSSASVSPPTPKEFTRSTPESSPTASQIPSIAQASSAPLTPDEIRDLQGKLKAAGFNPGAIDGTMGRQTRSAVREYAEARALPNPDATRELLTRLKAEAPASVSSAPVSSPSVSSPPVPQQFDKPTPDGAAPLTPDEIRDLQGKLKAAGFNPGAIDGTMGRQTRSAVREFAEAQGIPDTEAARNLLSR